MQKFFDFGISIYCFAQKISYTVSYILGAVFAYFLFQLVFNVELTFYA